MADNFKLISKKDLVNYTNHRDYETKIGELADSCENQDFESCISLTNARYILIGIPEQAGVLANYGKGGTQTLWPEFLKSFLNIQSNQFISGKEIFVAGYFDFSEEIKLISATAPHQKERVKAMRALVQNIDAQVEEIVKIVCRHKKVPILIGGGHNNAYGAIKGAAKGLHAIDLLPLAQVNAINLDAHTDYRKHEGRHSGNPFRYADEDGYLNKYFVLGAHENYLQQYVVSDIVSTPFVDFITYEDIFVREKINFDEAVSAGIDFMEGDYTGIELDLDSIKNTLSSAMTPSGISAIKARRFVHFVASECKIAYLHICEGAVELEDGTKNSLTGKLVSYIVSDFIKAHTDAVEAAKNDDELEYKNGEE